MSTITWGSELAVGFTVIDHQHEHWVGLYNDLADAVELGRGQEQVKKTLDELADYSLSHFRTEETLMKKHGYDDEEDYEQHLNQHRVFTDQIRSYQDRVDLGQWTLSKEVLDYMRDWLVQHITATDRGYISTFKKAGVP